jgi:STE24 endopeptidase
MDIYFSADWIARAILIFLATDLLIHLLADTLNLKALEQPLPDRFRDVFDPIRYAKSRQYLRTNTRFGQLTRSVDFLLLIGFWFAGGFALVDGWSRDAGWGPVPTGLVYIGMLVFIKALVDQPFSLYATFVIEERFGFNRTRLSTWINDRIKTLLLILLLGGPLMAGILLFFQYAGSAAWLWCWALITLFTLLVQFVAPTWIMPLFNRFEPLADGDLKSTILAYTRSIGFTLDDVYVMDGSRRSAKSNAFFTGFGRHRRIVLFDTLIERHSTDELLAILAHEMGHYKRHHILITIAAGILQTGVLLYLMSLVIGTPALFHAFYVSQPSIHAGLIFFSLLYTPVDLFLGLFMQAISRRHEYAADRYAATTTGKAGPMIAALKKLSADNLSNLTPHPFYVILNYSHPPMCERIRALEKIGSAT